MDKLEEQSDLHCDVVVVNYNAGEYLTRCVHSLYASDVPISVIIVDNASVDDSIDQITHIDPGAHTLKIVRNARNLGFSKGVNLGAKEGSSPFIFLLNPDCEIHPHTIRHFIQEIGAFEDCGVMGGLVFNEDGTEQRGCRRLEPTFTRGVVTAMRMDKYFKSVNLQFDDLPKTPIVIDAVSGSAMLVKRSSFEQVQGMDEDYFLHVEDLDFCRRIRESGKKVYFTPNVSLFHHHGASSHALPVHTEWHKHQGMLRYQSKFQKPNQSAVRSYLTRGVIYLHFVLSIVRKKLSHKKGQETRVQSLLGDPNKTIVITGASSDLGQALLSELKNESSVIAVSRAKSYPANIGNEIWLNWSFFEKVPEADFQGAHSWFALSPVWSAPELGQKLGRFGNISRIVAVSSTSILGKATTENSNEQKTVQALIDGEQQLLAWGTRANSSVTIARASMVYGGDQNQNIAFIQRMIKWCRFFPMLSKGDGQRQPVHVYDLAKALKQIRLKRALPNSVYTLAGGERLSYRTMIERVFESMRVEPKIKFVPPGIFKRIADVLSYIPGLRFINREMISRMEQDLVYDIEAAKKDFKYAPGKFRP